MDYKSTTTQLVNIRGIFEPYGTSGIIYEFDTFEGFLQRDEKDLSKGSDIKLGITPSLLTAIKYLRNCLNYTSLIILLGS